MLSGQPDHYAPSRQNLADFARNPWGLWLVVEESTRNLGCK